MSNLDTLYKAFADYRKVTADDRDCSVQRSALCKAGVQSDVVEIKRCVCTIEEDWVNAIEEGLTYIEKAIGEERQFIRNNGEILPIEKVKRVSRDSVEHLSRHSNLIRKKPEEGKDLVPEQLYTVERLSDYALYENRFLYMLLKYLEEFIGIRYNRIAELTNTYHGNMSMDKQISSRGKSMTFKIELKEERRNDPVLEKTNPNREVIDRIGLMMRSVAHFLATPLMQEVAKTPMLKPPITKTNVLKMNNNFKGAMKLYEFVMAYDRDGYTVEEKIKRLSPLADSVADEMAEIASLTSFLTYEHGMNIREELKLEYERELERQARREAERKQEQLESLRRRIKESGESAEEYMLMLEKRNKELESASVELERATAEIERVNGEKAALETKAQELATTVGERDAAVRELENKLERELAKMDEAHKKDLREQDERHKAELKEEAENRDRAVAEVEEKFEELKVAYAEEKAELIAECDVKIKLKDDEVAGVRAENQAILEEKALSDGRLNALRSKYGLFTRADDFTSEAAFNEIETQYNAFRTFFKKEWKKTKKRIRKETFAKKDADSERGGGADGSVPNDPEQESPERDISEQEVSAQEVSSEAESKTELREESGTGND